MALIFDPAFDPRAVLRHAQGASRCFAVTVGRTAKPGGSFHVHYYLRENGDNGKETGVRISYILCRLHYETINSEKVVRYAR